MALSREGDVGVVVDCYYEWKVYLHDNDDESSGLFFVASYSTKREAERHASAIRRSLKGMKSGK